MAPTSGELVPEGLTIRRSSTAEQVADALRGLMLSGDLEPGTRLREVPLASSLGVSRNTLREAIRLLVHEGLVSHSMHRGAIVARPTEEDVRDIFRARKTLEIAAVEAARADGAAGLAAVAEAVEELAGAVAVTDWQAIAQADLEFHRRLVALLGSRRLDGLYRQIQGELALGVSLVDREYRDPTELVAEHRELYELLTSGDAERCADRLAAHLDDAEQRLLRILRARSRARAAGLSAHERDGEPGDG